MRVRHVLAGLLLASCAGDPAPVQLDPEAHARLTLAGFREASPLVAQRLDVAAGWAVFADVEDTREACAHEGVWFGRDGASRSALLRCATRPSAPAGAAYHLLVLLADEADVAGLMRGEALDLEGARHFTTADEDPDPAPATRWVVTSERGGLLFGAWDARQTLELVAAE